MGISLLCALSIPGMVAKVLFLLTEPLHNYSTSASIIKLSALEI